MTNCHHLRLRTDDYKIDTPDTEAIFFELLAVVCENLSRMTIDRTKKDFEKTTRQKITVDSNCSPVKEQKQINFLPGKPTQPPTRNKSDKKLGLLPINRLNFR